MTRISFQRRADHVHSQHVNLLTGWLRHFLYLGSHRFGARHSSVGSGQKRTRTGVPHLSRGGFEVARCLDVGHHLLRHATCKEHST